MLHRAEQKLQTSNALMDAARSLIDSGRGSGSLSLREVTRNAARTEASAESRRCHSAWGLGNRYCQMRRNTVANCPLKLPLL